MFLLPATAPSRPAASTEAIRSAVFFGAAAAVTPFILGAAFAYILPSRAPPTAAAASSHVTEISPARAASTAPSAAGAAVAAEGGGCGAPPSTNASTAASPEASPSPVHQQQQQQQQQQEQPTAANFEGQSGNVLNTVDRQLPPVDAAAPCFIGPRSCVIFLGACGGKSTMAAGMPGAECVVDVECFVGFRRAKRHLAFAEISEATPSWEANTDMTSLFFRAVVPVTLASLALGHTATYNVIDPKSITLAAMFTSGIRQLFVRDKKSSDSNSSSGTQNLLETHRVAAFYVPSHTDMDMRLKQRAADGCPQLLGKHFSNAYFNYSWHRACHMLIAGAAQAFAMPLCSQKSPHVQRLVAGCIAECRARYAQLASDGFHILHFCHGGDFFTLLEILPLQFALYRGCWPGLTPSDSAQEDSFDMSKATKAGTPELVSWFVVPFPDQLGEEAREPQECDADVAAAVAATVTPPADLRGATWLRQSGYVAPGWGSDATPFRAILILSRRREVLLVKPGFAPDSKIGADAATATDSSNSNNIIITGVRVKMLQKQQAGYSSSFIPTWHLSRPEYRGRRALTATTASSSSSSDGGKSNNNNTDLVEGILAQAAEPVRVKQSLSMPGVRSTSVTPANSPQRAFITSGSTTSSSSAPRRKAVLVYFGSFSPFHKGHLETLELAQRTVANCDFEVVGSFVVPVAQTWPKEAKLDSQSPWAIRAAIAQLVTSHLGNVAVDFAQQFPNVCVESISQRVTAHFRALRAARAGAQTSSNSNNRGDPASLFAPAGGRDDSNYQCDEEDPAIFWINGSDISLTSYMAWLMTETTNVHMLVIPRGCGAECEAELALRRREAEQHPGRMIVSDLRPKLQLSSTQVRQAVKDGQLFAAADMIGNEAAAALFLWAFHEEEQGRMTSKAQYVNLGFSAPASR